MRQLRVAVVGAGAAGLCAARHILSRPDTFAPPVVYELTEHVGGTWFYEERTGSYDNGLPIHSSMYRDLKYCNTLTLPLFLCFSLSLSDMTQVLLCVSCFTVPPSMQDQLAKGGDDVPRLPL